MTIPEFVTLYLSASVAVALLAGMCIRWARGEDEDVPIDFVPDEER